MPISQNEMLHVVQNVWDAVLNRKVTCVSHACFPEGDTGLRTAFIQITGEWDGVVVCKTTELLARDIAAAMFCMDRDSLSCELVHDALGELANMIAGNLKALLPPPCFLCLPTVVSGSDYVVVVRDVQSEIGLALICDDQPFSVDLMAAPAERHAFQRTRGARAFCKAEADCR